MTSEEICPLVEEFCEIMKPEEQQLIQCFAEHCIDSSKIIEVPRFKEVQRLLKKYDTNNLRVRFNSFIFKVNPNLDTQAIWE